MPPSLQVRLPLTFNKLCPFLFDASVVNFACSGLAGLFHLVSMLPCSQAEDAVRPEYCKDHQRHEDGGSLQDEGGSDPDREV